MGAGHFGNNEVIQDPGVKKIVGDIFAQNNYNKPDDRLLVLGTYEKLLDLLTDWINGDDVVVVVQCVLSFYDVIGTQEFGVALKQRNPKQHL